MTKKLIIWRFHTPFGVTSLWTFTVDWAHGDQVMFPYALWRDFVLDPTPVGGAVTSGDAGGLHRL
jgi:hypothetical protein